MDVLEKLRILGEGAKYDASCATSGVARKNVGRVGNAACVGLCHSWSADGRCISLLKVLMSNDCVYDCQYCVNRRSVDVERASFTPEELADLAIGFYRRNYIEGLFLSSAVRVSPDHTAEEMLRCLRLLREGYGFAGYIHAKIIPGVSPELVRELGLVADRLSVNMELPSEKSLSLLAPQKKAKGIFTPMGQITESILNRKDLGLGEPKAVTDEVVKDASGPGYLTPKEIISVGQSDYPLIARDSRKKYKEPFAPAGQSTQMIIGASPETDRQIIRLSESLYRKFRLKRVYFSAYIAVSDSSLLPAKLTPPPLQREHRLYQADWLLRFYGFSADEILDEQNPFLDERMDPKMAWALRHPELFPMEVNKVSLEELLRIPGVGAVSARRIVRQRRRSAVKFDDLKKLGVVVKRAKYFLTCRGRYYGDADLSAPNILRLLQIDDGEKQLSFTDLKRRER